MLALPAPSGEILESEQKGICIIQRRLEAAGRRFRELYESVQDGKEIGEVVPEQAVTRTEDENCAENEEDGWGSDDEINEKWKKKNKSTPGSIPSRLKQLVKEKSLYQTLGVNDSASEAEIKKAYRFLALVHHPDKAKVSQLNEKQKKKSQNGSITTVQSDDTSSRVSDLRSSKSKPTPGRSQEASSTSSSPTVDSCSSSKTSQTKSTNDTANDSAGTSPDSESCHEQFLKIQEAYEILSDCTRRRQYDSALPFDDSIPTALDLAPWTAFRTVDKKIENRNEEYFQQREGMEMKFFELFDSVFKRNSRWSKRKPVPTIGDMTTSLKQTKKFYDFWRHFLSWRDFSVHEEYDLNEAESREERRWMDRQNKRATKMYIVKEQKRISDLVELAFENDPRLYRQKEESNNLKEAKRLEREQKKEMEEKEAQRILREKEEQERKLQEEKSREIEKRRALKLELKSLRKALKSLYAKWTVSLVNRLNILNDEELQQFCIMLDFDELKRICLELEGFASGAVEYDDVGGDMSGDSEFVKPDRREIRKDESNALNKDAKIGSLIVNAVQKHFMEMIREDQQKKDKIPIVVTSKVASPSDVVSSSLSGQIEWNREELSLLSKAIQKYPGGVAGRWEKISEIVKTKSVEEIIKKTKKMSESRVNAVTGTANKSVKQDLKDDVSEAFKAFMEDNTKALRKVDVSPDQNFCGKLSEVQSHESPAATSGTSKKSDQAPTRTDVKSSSQDKTANKKPSKLQQPWSKDQQEALELALIKYPSSMLAKERWNAIASDVPQKNASQCLHRFKEIREIVLSRQSQ